MKWILSISNEKSGFKIDASNGVYEANVDTSFKNLNNVKSCTLLYASTLNPDHKIDSIHFIWNGEDPIPRACSLYIKILISFKYHITELLDEIEFYKKF